MSLVCYFGLGVSVIFLNTALSTRSTVLLELILSVGNKWGSPTKLALRRANSTGELPDTRLRVLN